VSIRKANEQTDSTIARQQRQFRGVASIDHITRITQQFFALCTMRYASLDGLYRFSFISISAHFTDMRVEVLARRSKLAAP
jgi:hypothetical protein